MRVLVLTLGTRGDLELFLILARTLRERGHDVVLASSDFHAERVRSAGVDFAHVGTGGRENLLATLRSLAAIPDRLERTRSYYWRWLRPQVDAALPALATLGQTADYFVSNLKLMLQKGDTILPGAAVTYDPPASPDEPARYPSSRHGDTMLDLVALPRPLVDPANRWPDRFHFTGFWQDELSSPMIPPALDEFLRAGAPPIVATLGSMAMFDAPRLTTVLAAAARLAGCRCVLVGGWADLPSHSAPEREVLWIPDAPYDWLFPRASCVVHHGGTGTVAAVLHAGRPSIVLPQIQCQETFGEILVREHLAAEVLDPATLQPETLASAVKRAATDESIARAVQNWKQLVRCESGVRSAVDLIEAHAVRNRG